MPIDPRKEREKINRKVYAKKTFEKLKEIGKKKGLRNVDRYKKADRDILIEKLIKGKQLEDETKSVILKQAQNAGLKVNVSMSKETIKKIIANPKLTDYTKEKIKEIASNRGVPLPSQITAEKIIKRLENPSKFYTVNSLKQLLENNNVKTRGIKDKPTLINLAEERGLLVKPIETEEIQETKLWVSVKNIPEALRRFTKKKARNPREAIEDFKDYIKNLNKDYITPARLEKLSQQLKKKEEKTKRQEDYLFTPIEEKSAFKKYVTQYIIKGEPKYAPFEFMNIAKPYMINVMDKNRNTKVKLYLYCTMAKPDPDFKELIKRFAFHSIGQKKNNRVNQFIRGIS